MSDSTNIQINLEGDAIVLLKRMQDSFNKLVERTLDFEHGVYKAFNELNKQSKTTSERLKQINFSAIADNVRNVTEAFSGTMAPGVRFEQQMADLSAITGMAGSDLDILSEAAREVGKSSGLGAGQAAEAFKLLASNIDISKIGGVEGLKALQKETITLAQAAGVELPMAADTMSFALNQFNLPATDAARVINVLGAGAKFGAAEIPDLAESLKNAGSVANAAGVSIETTVGAIEVLSQNALKGAEAGTAMRNILLRLQTKEIPGVDLKTQGLSGALSKMTGYLNDTTAMEKIFGAENINAATILIKNASAVQEMTDRVTGTQVAYKQAEIRTKTYAHELEKVRAKVDDMKIGFFNATGALLPWSEYLIQALVPLSQMIPLFDLVGKGVKALTASQWALNAAQLAMPILAIVAGLAMIGAAIYDMTLKYDGISEAVSRFRDAELEANKKIVEERMEAQKLLKTARDQRLSYEDRTKALEKLKETSEEYFGQMTLEKINTEEATKAFDDYVVSLQRAAKAQALKDYAVAAEKAALDAEMGKRDKGFGESAGEYIRLAFGSLFGGSKGMANAAASISTDDLQQNAQFASEKRKESSLLFKKAYDTENPVKPSEPLIYSPDYAASLDKARGNINQKNTSVGAVNTTINIHTTNLEQSKGKIKEIVQGTLKEAITDYQAAY